MITDQDLGGRKEIIANSGKHVCSNANKIVLSLQRYLGKLWPKIYRTKLSEHVTIDTYAKDNVK
jgi:hypothetical protein